MTASDLRDSLNVFLKYDDKHIKVEQGSILASYTPPEKMSQEDRDQLTDLHWDWDELAGMWHK
jgi:hypothetical protein